MDIIARKAVISVARGCGFGALAIFCLMVGLLGEPAVALRAGGYSMLLMAFILLLKGWRAGEKPYKRTELWLLLEPAERPQTAIAQQVVGAILRETFLRFAFRAAAVAVALLMLSIVLAVVRSA